MIHRSKVFKRLLNIQGFTLIELMIALVIMGVLVSVAVPVYTDYLKNSRRADAVNLLLEASTKYSLTVSSGVTVSSSMISLGYSTDPVISPGGYYSIEINVNPSNYTMTATRLGSQVADTACGDLTINNYGVKSAINADEADPAKNCW